LVPSEGPSAYKQVREASLEGDLIGSSKIRLTFGTQSVDYAGVRRSIIYRNPPLFDEDGYEVDSGDDEERIEEAVATAAELNPYSNIRLES
jgi:hypothetical protein